MDIPRASQELKENSAEYQIFIDALGQLFKWIKQLVSVFFFLRVCLSVILIYF